MVRHSSSKNNPPRPGQEVEPAGVVGGPCVQSPPWPGSSVPFEAGRRLRATPPRPLLVSISVEYLAIFRRTDSFCDSVASFTRLLQVDSAIAVNNGYIRFYGEPTCTFQISGGSVAGKNQRYFQLRFTWDGDPDAAPAEMDRFLN